MKKVYFVLLLALFPFTGLLAQNNNVGIGTTTPNATAVLDVTSSNKGVLVPRLTTAQRTAIVSPAQGLLVYDTDLGCFYYYNTTTSAWVSCNCTTARIKEKLKIITCRCSTTK